MDSSQSNFLCVALGGSGILISYHTEPRDTDFPSMTLHVTLHLAPGDESLVTQSTVIWILPSMNLHVELYMVQGDETLATQESYVIDSPQQDSAICMCLFRCFREINLLPHRGQCHGFS